MTARPPVPVGRYQLFKSLKKGGMARVFLGLDPDRPDQLVAVKTLLPKLARQKLHREMFTSEGKVGLRLQHPNIVRTLDHGVSDGTAFIAMEFIFGFDLSTVLRRLRKEGRRIPIPLAVGLARAVAGALAYAHELTDEFAQPLDIVNRDVSPGNIMIGFDGRVKLIDFGIAQTTIDVKSQIGSIKGKISYMAPEQVRGLPVDARADLFSLGTVLYEMLTGVQVFHDEGDFATMERVRRAEAQPPSTHNPEVGAELDRICARAMTREVVDRYPSARDILGDLERWLEGRDDATRPEAMAEFLRSLFDRQIEEMRAEIEAARKVATGEPLPEESTDAPSGARRPPRLISEDTLAEMAGYDPEADPEPSPPTPAPAPTGGVPWVIVAAVVAAGALAAWLALR
jgi:serine/threonine protein kinase